jgi:hypothetical protein
VSATQTTNTYIRCDGDGCSEGVPFDYESSEMSCRRQLRADGWRCDDTGDYCPECAAKRKEE